MISILDRMVQPLQKTQQSLAAVEQIMGFDFRNKRFLQEALTNSSYSISLLVEMASLLVEEEIIGKKVLLQLVLVFDE
ncbi:hypothetical protein ACFX15_046537 [Malus domestica]